MPIGTRVTLNEYRRRLKKTHPTVEFTGNEFRGMNSNQSHRCVTCKYEWTPRPSNVLGSRIGCPECSKERRAANQVLDEERVRKRLKEMHGTNIKLMGQYRDTRQPHRFKCYTCLHTWKTFITNVWRGSGCPLCAGEIKRRNGRKASKVKELIIAGTPVRVQGYEPQAIEWLLANRKVKMKDLVLDNSGEVPTIRYTIARRNRNYYPDIFIPKLNRIVEVKSTYTTGLLTGKDWRKNQQKAKACIAAGYKFTMMVMNAKGQRFWLPPKWYEMTRKEVLIQCAFAHADHKMENWQEIFASQEFSKPRARRRRRRRR